MGPYVAIDSDRAWAWLGCFCLVVLLDWNSSVCAFYYCRAGVEF
jgi:hypothetical protein